MSAKRSPRQGRFAMARQHIDSTTRLIFLAPLAAGVTFSLFVLMQTLIRSDILVIEESSGIPEIRINWVPEDIVPDLHADIDEIEPVVEPPAINTLEFPDDRAQTPDNDGAISGRVVTVETGIDQDRVTLIMPRIPTPVFRLEPEYPRTEASRGIEGECTVHFDILASGETANIRISRCDTSGFERASRSAVANWRYTDSPDQPADEIVLRNTSVTLTFNMEE